MAVLPLFLVAVDWGRWMSMQAFGLTFVAVILTARRGPPAALNGAVYAVGLLICLMLGPHHVNLSQQHGLVATLAARLTLP
jgi:hypothetical protein